MNRLKEFFEIYNSNNVSDDYFNSCKQCLIENGIDENDITDEMVWQEVNEQTADTYDFTRKDLNKQLNNPIVCIADVGTWNGRISGYSNVGNNLNSVLNAHVNGTSDILVEYDGVNIISTEYHHDGTNHYIYRELKDNAPQHVRDAVECNEYVDNSALMKYTKSLRQYVKQLYGV